MEDVRQASADPLVREAMDLFNGSLVNVERLEEGASSEGKGEEKDA